MFMFLVKIKKKNSTTQVKPNPLLLPTDPTEQLSNIVNIRISMFTSKNWAWLVYIPTLPAVLI